jgi:transposase
MSGKRKRKNWSASEKMRIVLAGLEPGVEVSELCRREGIQPAQYYNWKNQLVSSADSVFGDKRRARAEARDRQRQADELRKKDAIIAEILAGNLELKKTL